MNLHHVPHTEFDPTNPADDDMVALWDQLRADAISASDRAEIDAVFTRYAACILHCLGARMPYRNESHQSILIRCKDL